VSQVDFYFDFSCPWSYLALVRLQDVCERNRTPLALKPVSVARILDTENPARVQQRFSANPAKASWQRKDIEDWAVMWGLKIDLADDWPQNRDAAAAAAIAADESAAGIDFCLAVFRAEYGANEDTGNPTLLASIAANLGLEGERIAAAAVSEQYIARVQKNSLELIERGGFGTPTMLVDEALFFGNDRVSLLEWTLGPMADEAFVIPGQHNMDNT